MSEVGHAGRREVERGDWELLGRSVELDNTGWGDASRWEVELGYREVLGRSIEVGDVGRSIEVN